jgi:hypothetical protein
LSVVVPAWYNQHHVQVPFHSDIEAQIMHPDDQDRTDKPHTEEDAPFDSDDDFYFHGELPTLPRHLTELELRCNADYEWCLRDPEVHKQYARQVVAAHHRRILASGKNHGEALQGALNRPDCPPREEIVLVYIEEEPLPPLP